MLVHRNQGHRTVLGISPEACPRTRTKAKMKSFWRPEGKKVKPQVRAGPGAVRKERSWRRALWVPTHSGLCAVTPDPLQDTAMVKSTVEVCSHEHGWWGVGELRGRAWYPVGR